MLVVIASIFVLTFVGLFVFMMATEFRPAKWSQIDINGNGKPADPFQREFTILTWNIGYSGLGAASDFFYDGGNSVRTGKKQTEQNLGSIEKFISENDSVDFILVQEVDLHSKRSWRINEFERISALLPQFFNMFATNYNCRYIPLPLTQPLGRVLAGLATFTRLKPDLAMVQYFDALFDWPLRMVLLKRCFMTMRFRLTNGSDLVLINTHNSAYDSTGSLRKRELFILDSAAQKEYRSGNYVIVGGDWNNNPRGFEPAEIITGDAVTKVEPPIESGFFEGWKFVFDSLRPTNRYLDIAYVKGKTRTIIIDFFIVSPNVDVEMIKTIPLNFASSDHEPVALKIKVSR